MIELFWKGLAGWLLLCVGALFLVWLTTTYFEWKDKQ